MNTGIFVGIIDVAAANNKLCSILFGFLGTENAHKLAVCDIFDVVDRDLTSVDELDGVGAFDATTHAVRKQLYEFIHG